MYITENYLEELNYALYRFCTKQISTMVAVLPLIFMVLGLVNQNSHTLTAAPVKGTAKVDNIAISNISYTWQNSATYCSLEQPPDADVNIPIIYSGTYANIVDLPFNWFAISVFLTFTLIVCVGGIWYIRKRGILTIQKQQLLECIQTHRAVGKAPKGITNIGNTCYMNSLLQVLSWTPQIRQELAFHLKACTEARNKPGLHGMSLALWEFIESYHTNSDKTYWITHSRKLDVKPILQEARKINSQFKGHEQQDSFELFNTIIEGVEDEQVIETVFQRFTSISVPMPRPPLQSKKEAHTHSDDTRCNENAYKKENEERLQDAVHSKSKDSVTIHTTTFNWENEQEKHMAQEIKDDTDNPLTHVRQETDMEISDDESSANIPINNMVTDLGSGMQGQVHGVAREMNKTPISEVATMIKRQKADLEVNDSETVERVYCNKPFQDNETQKEETTNGQHADSTDTTRRLDADNSSLSERSKEFLLAKTSKTEFHDLYTEGNLDVLNISHKARSQCFETLQDRTHNGTDVERGLLELTDLEQFDGTDIYCRKCNSAKEENTHKKMLVISAPPVLVLQINKFNQENGRLYKINQAMTYPLHLNLSTICSSAMQVLDKTVTPADGIQYCLYGVVTHIGSLKGGHYPAYVRTNQNQSQLHTFLSREWKNPMEYQELIMKHFTEDIRDREDRRDTHHNPDVDIGNQTDLWFYVSDMMVRKCEVSEATQDKNASMLFYERVN